jgi:general secretion pathway protein E
LKIIENLPTNSLPGIVTRIKILSGLDISERRIPQDGRMRLAIRGQEVDFRVSTIPAIHGETTVLRLLDQSAVALDLESLGFEKQARAQLSHLIRSSNGIVLVTGPTGSGKTTTIYALVSLLNETDAKIMTVEDPVEYRIHGVVQLQVNNATG